MQEIVCDTKTEWDRLGFVNISNGHVVLTISEDLPASSLGDRPGPMIIGPLFHASDSGFGMLATGRPSYCWRPVARQAYNERIRVLIYPLDFNAREAADQLCLSHVSRQILPCPGVTSERNLSYALLV